jgi:hypothetical protein
MLPRFVRNVLKITLSCLPAVIAEVRTRTLVNKSGGPREPPDKPKN